MIYLFILFNAASLVAHMLSEEMCWVEGGGVRGWAEAGKGKGEM